MIMKVHVSMEQALLPFSVLPDAVSNFLETAGLLQNMWGKCTKHWCVAQV